MPYKNSEDQYEARKRWVKKNKERHREQGRQSRARLKLEVLEHYGKTCACCEETEPCFLTVEHPNGGGAQHRKELGGGGYKVHLWLKRKGWPVGFQTLCMNCQFGRAHNKGICPHQAKKLALKVAA